MGNELIVGSRMDTFASEQLQPSTKGYGQPGYGGPSSLTPGQARKVSKSYAALATPIVLPSDAPGKWQTRQVSAKPMKPKAGMVRQTSNTMNTLPTSLSYGAPVPKSVKPAKRGTYSRSN